MLLRALIEIVVNLIPDISLEWPAALTNIVEWCYFMNYYIPVDTAIQLSIALIPSMIISAVVNIVLNLF